MLAGVSPTWYTYLEQGRGIQPSREVLDSLARVLRLSEDERRYVHSLAHGAVILASPLDAEIPVDDLIKQIVALFDDSPHPVYAVDQYCDLLGWNRAAREWYDDWDALPPDERNILRWMLLSPVARTRLPDWADDVGDIIARWRAESGRHAGDPVMQKRITELSRLSPDFGTWWSEHQVVEHRSRVRRFQHDRLGLRAMRLVPLVSPETVPAGIVLHLPVHVR